MKTIKEITVFADGDSSKLSTWSNVPFFFTETLISKGIKINRVDISPTNPIEKLFKGVFNKVFKLIAKKTTYNYFRSNFHFMIVRNKIKKAVKRFSNSDAHIFLTYSFSAASLTKKLIVQFGDWTYDHYFKFSVERQPNFLEKKSLKREESQILTSDLLFTLFPGVADYLGNVYPGKDIFYIGNVINSLYEVTAEEINEKLNSQQLLFVGSKKYIEGAKSLISAFENLKKNHPKLSLQIIGMEITDFKKLPPDVFCHGYLDKARDSDREIYYKLFKEATIFINTTPKWAAFSASIEAMYFYTPVIVTPYNEFVKTFGDDITFGRYCLMNTAAQIESNITDILANNSYKQLCINAHDAVKKFTWKAYIDTMVDILETKADNKLRALPQ